MLTSGHWCNVTPACRWAHCDVVYASVGHTQRSLSLARPRALEPADARTWDEGALPGSSWIFVAVPFCCAFAWSSSSSAARAAHSPLCCSTSAFAICCPHSTLLLTLADVLVRPTCCLLTEWQARFGPRWALSEHSHGVSGQTKTLQFLRFNLLERKLESLYSKPILTYLAFLSLALSNLTESTYHMIWKINPCLNGWSNNHH